MFGEWMRVLCLHNGGLGSDTLQARICLSNFRNNSDQLCLQNPHFIAQIFRIMAVDHADDQHRAFVGQNPMGFSTSSPSATTVGGGQNNSPVCHLTLHTVLHPSLLLEHTPHISSLASNPTLDIGSFCPQSPPWLSRAERAWKNASPYRLSHNQIEE